MEEIIKEEDPTMVVMVETKLNENAKQTIEGYKTIAMNRNEDGGGLMIAIKNELANVVVVLEEIETPAEMMWLLLSNTKVNVRIGVVYAPQESRTKAKDLKEMYKYIQKQIEEAKRHKQKVLIIGDFNCKIGNHIQGNKDEITKGGKLLLKMVEKMELEIMNCNNVCEGKWTRVQGNGKSVLDYVIMDKDTAYITKKMKIDESQEITPYHDTCKGRIYTDHNAVTVEVNWVVTNQSKSNMKTVINERTIEKYRRKTEKSKLKSKWLREDEDIQRTYTEWSEEAVQIAKEAFSVPRKKKHDPKEIRILRKKKKLLKQRYKYVTSQEKEIYTERRRLIEEHIEDIKKEEKMKNSKRVVQEIKSEKGFDGGAFWEYKKRIKGYSKETVYAMENSNGEVVEEPKQILEVYQEFYKELLSEHVPQSSEEIEIEEEMNKYIEALAKKVETKIISPFSEEEYQNMKKELKKGKAPDTQGWRYEMVINAGKDMEESILEMANKMVIHKIQPNEWKKMVIKSIDKGKGGKRKMNGKRGLFLTNIISKIIEKLLRNRSKEIIQNNISPYQCGGAKNRGITDNLLIMNTIIEEFKEKKQNLYILFADLEKCFDKLWLKDCIYEIVSAGMPEEEAWYIYQMNKDIKVVVETPVGQTEEFELEEVVRQGTVMGPNLCCVSTDRINSMGTTSNVEISRVHVKHPAFVDDVNTMGKSKVIEETGGKMNVLEKTKKFTYNNDKGKSEILKMIFNKKENEKESNPTITVKKGEIGYTERYQYLGDMYDESGTNMSKIKKKMEKADFMAYEVKKGGDYKEVGKADTDVRLLLLEQIVKPSLLYNTETWINITEREEIEINRTQYNIIKKVFEQKESTPYYGILSETGIWPYSYVIRYKKLMLYHRIMHSDKERIIRKIIVNEREDLKTGTITRKSWYKEIEEWIQQMGMEEEEKQVMNTTKARWRKMVKDNLEEIIRREIKDKTDNMTKMRWLKGQEFEKQEYIKKLGMKDVKRIMKMRLHMVDARANFKGKYEDIQCMACKEQEETTEHLLECQEYKDIVKHNLDTKNIEEKMKEMGWLNEASKVYEQIEEAKQKMGW